MKKYRIFILGLMIAAFSGCVDEDPGIVEDIKSTQNVIGFVQRSAAVSAVAGGDETEFSKSLIVSLKGPRLNEVSNDVTATVSVDLEKSTAVEGIHFSLPTSSFTIGTNDNNFNEFFVTMLTEGIEPPLDSNPQLVLNIETATGDGTVTTGAPIVIDFLYLCFADLSGTYTVTNDFCFPSFSVDISQNPDGSWYASVLDGGFLHTCTSNTTLPNWGSFNEVCGVIQPSTNLRFGSLGIGTVLGGTWDQENGVLIMQHEDTFFNGGPYSWESTYTRQ